MVVPYARKAHSVEAWPLVHVIGGVTKHPGWRAICETVVVNESRVQVSLMLHDLSRSCVDCVILSQKI